VNELSTSLNGIHHFDKKMMRFFDWTQSLKPEPLKYAGAEFYRVKGEYKVRAKEANISYQDTPRPQLTSKEEFKILGKRF
jgi:hypothetical protein